MTGGGDIDGAVGDDELANEILAIGISRFFDQPAVRGIEHHQPVVSRWVAGRGLSNDIDAISHRDGKTAFLPGKPLFHMNAPVLASKANKPGSSELTKTFPSAMAGVVAFVTKLFCQMRWPSTALSA